MSRGRGFDNILIPWEQGFGDSLIWYIYPTGENGDDSGGNGDDNGDSGLISFFGGFDFFFTFPPLLPLSPTGNLTNIPRQTANAIVSPAFVTGGSAADLNQAIAAYNQTMQSYEANYGAMSVAERAVAEVELAVANAAIKALQLVLTAQSGAAVDLTKLLSAYQAAQAVLNNNRRLLEQEYASPYFFRNKGRFPSRRPPFPQQRGNQIRSFIFYKGLYQQINQQ